MTDTQYSEAEGLTARLSPLANNGDTVVFLVAGLMSVLWAMFVSDKVALQPVQPLSWEQVFEYAVTHRIAKELANVPFAKRACRS